MVQKGLPGGQVQYTCLEGCQSHYSYSKGTGAADSAKADWERVMDREVFHLRSEGAAVMPKLNVARSQPPAERPGSLEVEHGGGMDLVLRCLDPVVRDSPALET